MNTKSRSVLFTNIAIAIVFSMAVTHLIYPKEYQVLHNDIVQENEQLIFKIATKHAILVGKKSLAGEKAWEYFSLEYLPRIFKECNGIYYTIRRHYEQREIPCTAPWFICKFRSPKYKYIPYHRLEAFYDISYQTELLEQDDKIMVLRLKLEGKSYRGNKVTEFFQVDVTMDYGLNVLKLICPENTANSWALFGEGKYPTEYDCRQLSTSINKRVYL